MFTKLKQLGMACLCALGVAALALTVPSVGIEAEAASVTASGTFKSGGSWSLDSDGVLTLSGDIACDRTSPLYNSDWPWYSNASKIKSIVSDNVILSGTDYYLMFQSCSSLNDISSLSSWDVSRVENMSRMFGGTSLSDITALKDWKTSSVTNMYGMFSGCTRISNLSPLASWNTSNVTNMCSMFSGCTRISNLSPLASWNTSNVTNISYMFSGCTRISNLSPLASWNTSNVTNMCSMFSGCTRISNLSPLASWNTSNVTNISYMFRNCTSLTDLTGLANWNTSNVTDMRYMFYNCTSLTDLTGLANWNTSKVANMNDMFYNCNLTNLSGLERWDTSSVKDMTYMFCKCDKLSDISALKKWDVSKVTNMSYMFCMTSDFSDRGELVSLSGLENWTTSSVTSLRCMFSDCSKLADVAALRKWDVSQVEDMRNMFSGCVSLVSVRSLASWDVSNVWQMESMFADCVSLEYLNLSGWIPKQGCYFSEMFSNCKKLSEIDTGYKQWDAAVYRDGSIYGPLMFDGCVSLPNYTSSKNDCAQAKPANKGGYFKGRPVPVSFVFGEFTNTYTAEPIYISFSGQKKIWDDAESDKQIGAGDFSFSLKNESGNIVETVENDDRGVFVFSDIALSHAGTFIYTIVENCGNDEHITYDETVKMIEIEVAGRNGKFVIEDYTVTDFCEKN